jgi:hypothetical protein
MHKLLEPTHSSSWPSWHRLQHFTIMVRGYNVVTSVVGRGLVLNHILRCLWWSVNPATSFCGVHYLWHVLGCGRSGDSMGNIHNSVEVATLVPQGNLMPFHHHSTIGLVVLAMAKYLLVTYVDGSKPCSSSPQAYG